jgi:hypothetical protein
MGQPLLSREESALFCRKIYFGSRTSSYSHLCRPVSLGRTCQSHKSLTVSTISCDDAMLFHSLQKTGEAIFVRIVLLKKLVMTSNDIKWIRRRNKSPSPAFRASSKRLFPIPRSLGFSRAAFRLHWNLTRISCLLLRLGAGRPGLLSLPSFALCQVQPLLRVCSMSLRTGPFARQEFANGKGVSSNAVSQFKTTPATVSHAFQPLSKPTLSCARRLKGAISRLGVGRIA